MTKLQDLGFSIVLDDLATEFAGSPWSVEIAKAREEFDAQRGAIYDDDVLFEVHLAAFLEWYLLERPLPHGRPPVMVVLEQRGEEVGSETRAVWRALALSQRSLFEVVDRWTGQLLLSDLILDGLWRVDLSSPMDGIDPGDIFEARLVPWEGRVVFGPVFCFHPRQARDSIHRLLREAEAAGALGLRDVSALAEMRLRHDRFRNIAIDRIYTRTKRDFLPDERLDNPR